MSLSAYSLAGEQESASALGVVLAWAVVRVLRLAQDVGWPSVAALVWILASPWAVVLVLG